MKPSITATLILLFSLVAGLASPLRAAELPRALVVSDQQGDAAANATAALQSAGWETGTPALPPLGKTMPNVMWAARWTGFMQPKESGNYTFIGNADDRIALTVDGKPLFKAGISGSGAIALEAGKRYPIIVEFSQIGGDASVNLSWRLENGPATIVPAEVLLTPDGKQAGLLGAYYIDDQFKVVYTTRIDAQINFNWKTNAPITDPIKQLTFDGVRLVVLSATAPLPDETAGRLAAFVRGGGGLLVAHTSADPNYWWNSYRRLNAAHPNPSPLWDALPFTLVPIADQQTYGIRNPFGPTRVLRQAESPLLKGVDLTQAPRFPLHGFMVLPTHPIVQGTHLLYSWSDDQYKSPLWSDGQVLAWGDDPEQRPLLLKARYGAGRAVAAAVPLFDADFLAWPGSKTLLKNLTQWLAEATPATPAPERVVYGVGVPWIVSDSLQRMGLRVAETAEGATAAVVYGVPTAEQAQTLATMARAQQPVIVANPAALQVAPLSELVKLEPIAPPAQAPAQNLVEAPAVKLDTGVPWWGERFSGMRGWAWDAENAGLTGRWFTAEGAATVKWYGGLNDPLHGIFQGPATDPAAPKTQIAWSKTYRWRLEGNLLDRRDLIEGWEAPAYDDTAWTEQTFGQNPPPPTVAGVTAPAQNLLAGAVWARARLTLTNPQASRGYLSPSTDTRFVTFLDGKPLRQPVAVRTLAAGDHLIALRAWPLQHMTFWASENPWGKEALGLHWPGTGDNPWQYRAAERGEADGFFAAYHPDWLAGWPETDTTGWFQIQLDAQPTRPPYVVADRPGSQTDTLVWLDGRPLGTVPQTIDLPKLTPGAHVLTLLKRNAGKLSVAPNARSWFMGTLTLAADADWNAIQIDAFPAGAELYINGQKVESGTGLRLVPLHPGDNLFVCTGLTGQDMPRGKLARAPFDMAALNTPDAQRLAGIWYRRDDPDHQALAQGWPATLHQATPPEGWTSVVPASRSVVASVPDEGARWFAAPFQVSAAEAAGPARLVFDAPGGVPVDVVKTLWVNGKAVAAETLYAASRRHETNRPTLLSFTISGLLKPGVNWVAFPVDLQGIYGVRIAAPAGLGGSRSGWLVPLPKLDCSGQVDQLRWTGDYARLGVASGKRAGLAAPPAGATVLARFSDGAPAVAKHGSLVFALCDQTLDWSAYLNAGRVDWAITTAGQNPLTPANMERSDRLFTEPVSADGAQVVAALLRPTPAVQGAALAADGGATVRLAPAPTPRQLSWQHRNWQGMLLAEGRIDVPAKAASVTLPAPAGDPSPMTTKLRADRWLRLALLDGAGTQVQDYLETRLFARPAVEVLLAATEQTRRDLPATLPGAPNYSPDKVLWNLAAERPASGVVVPGERIQVRAMLRNTTDQAQTVKLDLDWEDRLIGGKPARLATLDATLAPREQRTLVLPCGFRVGDLGFQPLAGDDPAPLRQTTAGKTAGPALTAGQLIARGPAGPAATLPLSVVRPWRRDADDVEVQGQQGAPGGFEMLQFALTPSLESLADPKHRWWDNEQGGNWFSAIDWWRDHLVQTTGNGGDFGGFSGKKGFAWGPFDFVAESSGSGSMALDNAGYLPDGTQYQEFMYASISREYNRFLRGNQPLYMEVADFWANGKLSWRERNFIHFLRWRRAQGRPLNVTTTAEMVELKQKDPAVREDWRIFSRDSYLAWTLQFMAGLPPRSINGSQGEAANYLLGRQHDSLDATRIVLNAHNRGYYQPTSLRRRGELLFGWFRALTPKYILGDEHWYYYTGHSQTPGEAWGENGSVLATPEWTRLMNLDPALIGILDDDGQVQPLANLSLTRRNIGWGPMSLFSVNTGSDQATCSMVDLLYREATLHLFHLIQPERVLGACLVPNLEYAAADKLDGSTINFGMWAGDVQPAVVLSHVLRNYGVSWGGVVAPDRLDKLQPGAGAVVVMPSGAPADHARQLADLVRRGGNATVFFSTGGTKSNETPLAELFGVKYAPIDKTAQGGATPATTKQAVPLPLSVFGQPQYVVTGKGRDFLTGTNDLAGRALLRGVEAGKGRAVFSALNPNLSWGWDHDVAREIAKAVNWAAGNPVTLPDGVGGYAFEAQGMTFLVLQDLKYTGGPATVTLRLPPGDYSAVDLYTGAAVPVARADAETVRLTPLLPPNGSTLLAVRNEKKK